MTEQSPSAEALSVANRWVQPYLPTKTSNANAYSCAQAIDALIARRSVIMRLKTLGMRPLPSAPASTGEQPAPPAAVVDYTERARELHKRLGFHPAADPGFIKIAAEAFSAVASEHQAEIASLREQVNYFKTEYQDDIGLSGMREERDNAVELAKFALLARLREPDVREAVIKAIKTVYVLNNGGFENMADAALTKIAEMLT